MGVTREALERWADARVKAGDYASLDTLAGYFELRAAACRNSLNGYANVASDQEADAHDDLWTSDQDELVMPEGGR